MVSVPALCKNAVFRVLCLNDVVFQSQYSIVPKMPFPIQVIVTLENEEGFSCPPGEFRVRMTEQLKVSFGRKLQPEMWGDLEADLWASVQRLPLFKQQKLMVKLRSMKENKEDGYYNFKVFLTKRPDVWPRWEFMHEVSEDAGAPPEVFFSMEVTVNVVTMDSLQKSSALLVGKMSPEFQVWEGQPLPKILKTFVNSLITKDLCK